MALAVGCGMLKETAFKAVSGQFIEASTPDGRVSTGGRERTRQGAGGRVPVRFERTGGCIEGSELRNRSCGPQVGHIRA